MRAEEIPTAFLELERAIHQFAVNRVSKGLPQRRGCEYQVMPYMFPS